jgi:hypothetical protein
MSKLSHKFSIPVKCMQESLRSIIRSMLYSGRMTTLLCNNNSDVCCKLIKNIARSGIC